MTRTARRTEGDAGVTLILFALALIAIMTMVAIVIDLSNVRNTRQDSKSTTDAATSAGLVSLASDGIAKPWRGVCSALAYLQANQPDRTFSLSYFDGTGSVSVPGDPCVSGLTQVCNAGTPSTWAWIRATDGDFVADIRSGYVTPDSAFPEDATSYSGDNGLPLHGGCDQLAVIAARRDPALFGGAAGATGYGTKVRSVGRVVIANDGEGNPAFLILERKACDALSEQVGSGEAGIIVDAASATESGFIHVDSAGSPAAGCNGNNNPGGWTVYSSGSSGVPKIVANSAANGTPGVMAIHALEVGLPPVAYGGSTAAGLSPAPTPGSIVSRKPIDDHYNPAATPTITTIHAAARVDANRTTAPDLTWRTLTCADNNSAFPDTKIFVNCPGGFAATNVTFSNAQQVIFNGPVTVANNAQLYMPAAQRVVVGGNSNGGLAVAGGGVLGINSVTPFANTDVGVTSACTGREGPAWSQTTQLVIFGGRASGSSSGALNLGGRAAMCQTFVFLAGSKTSAYDPHQTTDGVYDPTCTVDRPCHKANDDDAFLAVSGLVQWSAPNQMTTQPAPGSVGVEDLALWALTSTLSEVKSGGDLRPTGVFFLPNDRMEMRSPASATPRDAQFIARSLQLLQGSVRMKPTPSNTVVIPKLAGIGMVR